jgi:transcriptional regulator with XRE-family HTH domain
MVAKKPPTNFVRAWRIHRGYERQEDLAKIVGVKSPTISRLETGVTPYTQELLESVANALKCRVSDLLDRDPNAPPSILDIYDGLPERLKPAARAAVLALQGKRSKKSRS